MFFTLKDGATINVNAIMKLPKIIEGADDKTVMNVLMVDGSTEYVFRDDFLEIRGLVISRLL